MEDLWLGMAINLIVSAGCGFVVRQLSREWPLRCVDVAGVVVAATLVMYVAFVWDRLWLASWLPFSNLIVLGNGLPIFAAVLIGLTCRRLRAKPGSRWVVVGLLTMTGVAALVRPLLGSPPACENRWDQAVCLQTTAHTCSAASAATVLRFLRADASESEMARLCLTRKGTHWMGLFRGLCRKLPDGWRIEPLERATREQLHSASRTSPAILFVSLPQDAPRARQFRTERGWIPGISHSVVCFGEEAPDQWLIADPANGIERWTTEELRLLWRGDGLRLSRRP